SAGRDRTLRDSGRPPSFRFFIDKGLLQSDVGRYEPRPSDGSIDGYVERLRSLLGESRFGLTANEFHCSSGVLAKRLRALLRPIYERFGMDPHFTESFCFIGNSPITPFGIHIDQASNLTYVVKGKKRYRLIPGPVLKDEPHVHCTSDYGPYLDRGVTLEAS